jgi:hypothetical protein
MTRRHKVWTGAGIVFAILVGLGVWGFPKLFKPVTEQLPLPPSGEAAYNPLYALKLALIKQGRPVSAWPNLSGAEHALGPHDTLLIYDRPEAMPEAQAQRLLAWVRGGGHLVMPGPSPGQDPGSLARALGLRAFEPPADAKGDAAKDDDESDGMSWDSCPVLTLPGQRKKDDAGIRLCDPPFVASLPGFALGGGDEAHGWRFARGPLGDGLVTVSQLDYLGNESLRRPEARAMAWQLLGPRLMAGRVHLVYSAEVPSLFRLLADNGWMVLLPLALALLAWLLWRGARFGPIKPVPAPRRRALLEHVQASGEFAWARNRGAALHAAVLRLFHRRLQFREPSLFALGDDAQAQALAERLALPLQRVRQALRPQGLQHPGTFTQSIATLLQMRLKL